MSFYGWYSWTKNSPSKQLRVKSLKKSNLIVLILGGISLSILLAFTVDRFSDAELPYLDAFTTVFAIVATWMVVKRMVENWIIWVVVDFIGIFMYSYKELYITSLLFTFYTVVAVFGYFSWRKTLNNQAQAKF